MGKWITKRGVHIYIEDEKENKVYKNFFKDSTKQLDELTKMANTIKEKYGLKEEDYLKGKTKKQLEKEYNEIMDKNIKMWDKYNGFKGMDKDEKIKKANLEWHRNREKAEKYKKKIWG